MRFKYEILQAEYKTIVLPVATALAELEVFSKANGFPEPIITHVDRTPGQSSDIYWKEYFAQAGRDEIRARALAARRFSWHMVRCAVDLRDYIYNADQLDRVLGVLRHTRQGKEWEILGHDTRNGHHLHVGYRDFPRYKEWLSTLT